MSTLPQAGRRIFEEIETVGTSLTSGEISEAEAESRTDVLLDRLEHLPHENRGTIIRILGLKAQAHAAAQREHAQAAEDMRRYAAMVKRAQELEQAEGNELRQDMTLAEAIKVLRQHG